MQLRSITVEPEIVNWTKSTINKLTSSNKNKISGSKKWGYRSLISQIMQCSTALYRCLCKTNWFRIVSYWKFAITGVSSKPKNINMQIPIRLLQASSNPQTDNQGSIRLFFMKIYWMKTFFLCSDLRQKRLTNDNNVHRMNEVRMLKPTARTQKWKHRQLVQFRIIFIKEHLG